MCGSLTWQTQRELFTCHFFVQTQTKKVLENEVAMFPLRALNNAPFILIFEILNLSMPL